MPAGSFDSKIHAFDLMVDGIRTMISVSSFMMTVLLGFISVIDEAKIINVQAGLWGVYALALAITLCIYLQGVVIRKAQDNDLDIEKKSLRYPYTAILALMFGGMALAIIFGVTNISATAVLPTAPTG